MEGDLKRDLAANFRESKNAWDVQISKRMLRRAIQILCKELDVSIAESHRILLTVMRDDLTAPLSEICPHFIFEAIENEN